MMNRARSRKTLGSSRRTLATSIIIESLVAGYGAARILHGVSLRLEQGETVVLLGANGNGKSTLINCLMGLIRPTEGTISLEEDGEKLNLIGLSTEAIVDRGIALVPEGRRLFPNLTVRENLLLGAYRPAARATRAQNLEFCLEAFPALADRQNQLAASMSGGEQQMVALARAFMSAPRFLIVDEPSVGLAPIMVTQVINKIDELKSAHGLTVLMAEQNFNQAIKIADRGYVMVQGKVAFEGANASELRDNDFVKKVYLGT